MEYGLAIRLAVLLNLKTRKIAAARTITPTDAQETAIAMIVRCLAAFFCEFELGEEGALAHEGLFVLKSKIMES